jgi:hypothetical protein
MRPKRKIYAVLGLVLSLALAVSLMSCATTERMKMLEQQVQQASQDAKDAKALSKECDCAQQVKQADAAAVRAEKAADAAEASAQKAQDMANKAEAIFNKQMKK